MGWVGTVEIRCPTVELRVLEMNSQQRKGASGDPGSSRRAAHGTARPLGPFLISPRRYGAQIRRSR
jgi:hypothetical protein